MPKKESRAQGRERRAQFEVFLNGSRKFMKKNFESSGYAKRLIGRSTKTRRICWYR